MKKDIEITQSLDLTPEQFAALELHSIINILGVIRNEIELFNLEHNQELEDLGPEAEKIAKRLYSPDAVSQLRIILSSTNYYSIQF